MKISKVKERKDEIVDLVDMGSHNRTTVARSKLDPELNEGQGSSKPVAQEDPEPD